MSNFTLRQDGFTSYTSVPNCFIEQFMPTAAGEFVKIYIYLLKCVEENRSELSIPKIADAFNNTEKDVIRALKYWERKGLLKLTFENDRLASLNLVSLNDVQYSDEPTEIIHRTEPAAPKTETMQESMPIEPAVPKEETVSMSEKAAEPAPSAPVKKEYTRAEIESFSQHDDISMLLFSVQQYLGRPLTGADTNTILFCYDSLHFNVDLIEYLFEYCVSAGHKSIRYIEKTAINWAESGIKTVKTAKDMSSIYSGSCYPVMKELGIDGRKPSKTESDYVSKWIISYGFDLNIVLEACRRTINNIHQPSFEYTDSILKNWKANKVTTFEDIRQLDEDYEKSSSAKAAALNKEKNTRTKTDNFSRISQRSYNFKALEEKLFNQ